MKWHNLGLILLPSLILLSGCASTNNLRPEDAPYNVLGKVGHTNLQQNLSLMTIIEDIESDLSLLYTNRPPFHFCVDPRVRSLTIYGRYDTMPANIFLRFLRQDTGVYISTRKHTVYIGVPPSSPTLDLIDLPTCDYSSTSATIFDVFDDINTKLEKQYGTNVPVVFRASRNISTNETIGFFADTPSIKVFSEMVSYSTFSNYRRMGKTIYFYNTLADEDLIIEQAGPGYPPQGVGSPDP